MKTLRSKEEVITKLKNLKALKLPFEVWLFGSFIQNTINPNDIDIAIISKNRSTKIKINNFLNQEFPNSVIEEAINYGGGGGAKDKYFHFLLITDSHEDQKHSIYNSIMNGALLWKN